MTYDIQHLIRTDISIPIDENIVADVLSNEPFASVPGTINLRDVGRSSSQALRSGYIYRSGCLEFISEAGKSALRDRLNIQTVFDLRSLKEREASPPPDIPGVEIVWVPSTLDNAITIDAPKPTTHRENLTTGLYLDLLESHKGAFRAVLMHIRDRPDKPLLFHCTAGKDRTGVLGALVLGLADTPLPDITLDYLLTRIGIEPFREFLTQKLSGGKPLDLTDPKHKALATVGPDAMTDLLKAMDEEYGGVESYATDTLGLAVEDVRKIRENLKGGK